MENTSAIQAFVSAKADIDAMLDRFAALSGNHFNVTPDAVNWGHVGTLAYYRTLLSEITAAAFNEGEHA